MMGAPFVDDKMSSNGFVVFGVFQRYENRLDLFKLYLFFSFTLFDMQCLESEFQKASFYSEIHIKKLQSFKAIIQTKYLTG